MLFTEETKAAWIAALRSGEYTQGYGGLVVINSETKSKTHCCLGVLADVMGASEIDNPDEGLSFRFDTAVYGLRSAGDDGHYGGFIPRSIIGMGMQNALVQLNDSERYTFNDIADRLEAMSAAEIVEESIVPKVREDFDY